MARPRGAARGSASAILGMPELAEKRTVTGTSCLKCNALLTLAASALGTNLPSRTTPLAWADRCVVCLPNAALSASTNDSGVVAIAGSFRVFIAVLRWNDPFPRATRPRVLAFKLDLDAFLYLHRSCPCQTGQPSELFIFRVSAPDEGQHGRERSSGKVGKRCRGGSHRCRRNPLWHSTKWKRFRHGTRSQIR